MRGGHSLYGTLHLYVDAEEPLCAARAQQLLVIDDDVPPAHKRPRYARIVRTLLELVRDGAVVCDRSGSEPVYRLRRETAP